MSNCKTILVCPLNWGLGHATRDIPIIRRLLQAGFRVVVATEPPLTQLFLKEIPEVEVDFFPGPKIAYSHSKFLLPKLFLQLPAWIIWMRREKSIIRKLAEKHQAWCIISDNRYGVRHKSIKSIFITHQLMLKLPGGIKWMEKPAHLMIKHLIQKFDECWIPDNPPSYSLAGDLVHKYPLPCNARLIGPLSRFMDSASEPNNVNTPKPEADILAILSGPEPQKTILKNRITATLKNSNLKTTILSGDPQAPGHTENNITEQIRIIPHLSQAQMLKLIKTTPTIICRSGYTSIMDLWYLNKSAILVPTPGQTEQEYLATFNNRQHTSILQNKITLQRIISVEKSIEKQFPDMNGAILLDEAIRELL